MVHDRSTELAGKRPKRRASAEPKGHQLVVRVEILRRYASDATGCVTGRPWKFVPRLGWAAAARVDVDGASPESIRPWIMASVCSGVCELCDVSMTVVTPALIPATPATTSEM